MKANKQNQAPLLQAEWENLLDREVEAWLQRQAAHNQAPAFDGEGNPVAQGDNLRRDSYVRQNGVRRLSWAELRDEARGAKPEQEGGFINGFSYGHQAWGSDAPRLTREPASGGAAWQRGDRETRKALDVLTGERVDVFVIASTSEEVHTGIDRRAERDRIDRVLREEVYAVRDGVEYRYHATANRHNDHTYSCVWDRAEEAREAQELADKIAKGRAEKAARKAAKEAAKPKPAEIPTGLAGLRAMLGG